MAITTALSLLACISCVGGFSAVSFVSPLPNRRRAAPALAAAANEASNVVPMEVHAKAMIDAGRALLQPILDQIDRADTADDDALPPDLSDFKDAYTAFRLAQVMDPENTEAEKELERIHALMKTVVGSDDHLVSGFYIPETVTRGEDSPEEAGVAPAARSDVDADVVIVGAGAAGIGQAVSLIHTFGLDASRVRIIERGEAVGASFRQWPEEMRFISPSFNQAGWTSSFDLNAVAHGSSPAYSLHAQHPSGKQYADYLDELGVHLGSNLVPNLPCAHFSADRAHVQALPWRHSASGQPAGEPAH